MNPYPEEYLDDGDDNGTMPQNVEQLRSSVVGRRIVSAEQGSLQVTRWGWTDTEHGLVITLDDGTRVMLSDTNDCCAGTWLNSFLLNPNSVDHIITGVGTTEAYQRWHIFADFGDVMELSVSWSSGNPFYYGYGFDIHVVPEVGA